MGALSAQEKPMPTYETPEPITATIEIVAGDVRISAGDRSDTIVDVEPSDASNDEDRKAAELTRVEYANGRLLLKAPKLRSWLPGRTGGSISVTIELPAGSSVHGTGSLADFDCDGPLGECRIKTGLGRIQLDRVETLTIKSATGDISVDHVAGHADIRAGSGEVRVRELETTAVIKNSNGDTWVGDAGGDLRVNAANGNIAVDLARATVGAKSANGDVRLGEVVRGSVVLETRLGDLEVGIREGTAAWLDVRSTAGKVHNALDAADAPEPSTDTVAVRARTTVGDVLIRRP
jgi:Putative adhesin